MNIENDIRTVLTQELSSNLGSYKYLSDLFRKIPQQKNRSARYLIAGSWAIEFMTGKHLNHNDLDIILLQDPVLYIDNAKSISEKCDGIIPIPIKYFKKANIIACKNTRGKGKIFLPSMNIQLCLKIIGELDKKLSRNAVSQLELILSKYSVHKNGIGRNILDIMYILKCCTPEDLLHKALAKDIMKAVILYKPRNSKDSLELLEKVHRIINASLRKVFRAKAYNL